MNLYPATAFIRHLLTARSAAGHGVHSPFVFDFLTLVVRGKSDKQIIREVESLRGEMLADRRVVRVTDLGAGSAVHKGQERRISEIASTAALPTRYAMLLSRIVGSIIGVPSDLRSIASAQAESSIFNTRKSGKDKGREDVGGEANLPIIKEKQEPLLINDHGNLTGGQAAEIQSHQASNPHQGSEEYDKATKGRTHGAEVREPVESHSGGREHVECPPGGQEQGQWTQKQITFPGRPGSGSPGIILELGTSLGISTLALALAAPERRVVTVEGCPALAEIASENLRRHGAANTEVLNMDFTSALSLLRSEGTRVSMAFIDGNHRGEALKQYVSEISTMGDEMIIVADDIHLNRDMYNTWRSLADPSLQEPASCKAPSRAEKIPRLHSGTATATAEKIPPVHQGTAPATAGKTPPVHPARAAAAEKTPPVHTGTAPATAEKMPPMHQAIAPATMETFRFGILFCLKSLTPRHYRIRY